MQSQSLLGRSHKGLDKLGKIQDLNAEKMQLNPVYTVY